MRHGPDHRNWAPLLIIRKGNIVSLRVFVELPLELILVTWSGITWTCIWSYSICEPQGLSNLAPSRSRLFKLIGRVRQIYVELQQATSIYGGYLIRKRE